MASPGYGEVRGMSRIGRRWFAFELIYIRLCCHVALWLHRLHIPRRLKQDIPNLHPSGSYRNDLAPSWSWASVNNAVDLQQIDDYEGYDLIPLASVEDVNTHEEECGDRSRRVVGSIRLRCTLNPVKFAGNAERYWLEGKGVEEYVQNVCPDSLDVIGAEHLYFAPLFDLQTPNSLQKWDFTSEVRGILLQAQEDSRGVYKRCGHVFIAANALQEIEAFAPQYEAIKSPAGKAGLPCMEYNPSSGHLITLV